MKRFMRIFSLVIAVGLPVVVPPPVYGGDAGSIPERDRGIKYIRNFSRKDYNLQSQNWSVIQDRRGLIYVGNQGGLLEFDGVSWREIPVPNKTVRSLAVADQGIYGTIYVGGMNEIGSLKPDARGKLRYVSLIPHLDEKYRRFSHVWRTHCTAEGVYFCTSQFLFLWNSKEVKVWKAEESFAPPFLCGNRLYTRHHGLGLLEMRDGKLGLMPGGDNFSSRKIYMMVEFAAGKLLLGTWPPGFYIYDGGKVTPFETAALDFVKENVLSYGIRLASGDFALATLRGGMFVIDSRGRLKQVFDISSGLPDNTVHFIYEDFQGNLWLALGEGLSKIEYTSPVSIYDDKRLCLPGKVLSAVRHGAGNDLYAGTTDGLYRLDSSGKFRQVPGIPGECWALLSSGGALLAAATDGVFQVENNRVRQISGEHSYCLLQAPSESNRIWVGKTRGMTSLSVKNQGGSWEVERQFEDITLEIRTIAADNKGNLWLGTLTNGVLKVESAAGGTMMKPVLAVTRYHTAQGLPEGQVRVFTAADHLMFATRKGIFRFDETNKVFIPDTTLGDEFAGGEQGNSIFLIREDRKKNVWIHSHARNIQAIARPDGTFVLNKKPFLRLPLAHVDTIYPDPDGETVWFASVDGLIRYDTRVKKNCDLAFHTLVRRVWINGELFFDGYKDEKPAEGIYPVIPFKDRNLRFHFAAPFFEAETRTRYQCRLEGYDDHWTAWSGETWRDYTNLDSGSYTFRVRAKNVYGSTGSEANYRFTVLPPWYKTWWAFAFYAVTAALMVILVVKWRSWKWVQETQRLEQIVKDRTGEINRKNRQLEEQSEKLKEMDQVKSRFFANISHEFRTPLTLIMGPLEQMLTAPQEKEKEQKKKMRLMQRNSRRLLGLINQLLDLSKFDSGKMKLQACRQNIVPFLKGIVESFDSLAVKNGLDLEFHTPKEDITLYFDGEKLEKAVCNLLINAVKFTPPGGRISVALNEKIDTPAGFLEISVSDTGIGISGAQSEHIFDRFYQAQGLKEHAHKGSGIGLALTKELVGLHHGDIFVHSREGMGSEFTIRLPLGDEHLKPEDIVRHPETAFKPEAPGEEPGLSLMEEEEAFAQTMDGQLGQGKNIILVVEDSADVRAYIRSAIEPHYRMMEAKDGQAGIGRALEMIPDLIISDVMMPGVDGYELCRVLKNDVKTSHIPIILLTARAGEEDIIAGLETGADDYITKPFNTRILCARIQNLIDLRRHFQQTLDRQMTLQPAEMSVSAIDKEFLKDLQHVIDENLGDPEFNVERLCRKLYMSHATLYRKIHALTGETPTDFIRSYRLRQGADLLKKGAASVLEVAFKVGFSSANYFSKCFKKKFHQLPTEYQASESS